MKTWTTTSDHFGPARRAAWMTQWHAPIKARARDLRVAPQQKQADAILWILLLWELKKFGVVPCRRLSQRHQHDRPVAHRARSVVSL